MALQPLKLDYFYGGEADQYSFYRIPKVLFTDPCNLALSMLRKTIVYPEAEMRISLWLFLVKTNFSLRITIDNQRIPGI